MVAGLVLSLNDSAAFLELHLGSIPSTGRVHSRILGEAVFFDGVFWT